jgi:hypothetical protein
MATTPGQEVCGEWFSGAHAVSEEFDNLIQGVK